MSTEADALLTAEEQALWHAWKIAGETVMARVGAELSEECHLSGADFGVLSRLGDGPLRQQELAVSMRWDRTRLSHHLTRMEKRELVRRTAKGKVVTVMLTPAGKKELAAARPVHARAIRTHLIAKLGPQRRAFLAACSALVMP